MRWNVFGVALLCWLGLLFFVLRGMGVLPPAAKDSPKAAEAQRPADKSAGKTVPSAPKEAPVLEAKKAPPPKEESAPPPEPSVEDSAPPEKASQESKPLLDPKSGLEFIYVPGLDLWFGKTEVTVAAYARCVKAKACEKAQTAHQHCNEGVPGRENNPVNCVNWSQAKAFCSWMGARLPTEREWDVAATSDMMGATKTKYPWGNSAPIHCLHANYAVWVNGRKPSVSKFCEGRAEITGLANAAGTVPVGSYPEGRTPLGLQDMAGNVMEWTASFYDTKEDRYVMKGGGWKSGVPHLDVSYLVKGHPTGSVDYVGFRCVRDFEQ